ncbi:hypothetical protein PU850_004066 [Cronobacter dublinensis]|uniref:hypothetical protein n=1 Tax=Cronobacter dublinensis TaxID=413497 RepID=UPI0024AFBF5C|nr:hypothetical protein [Cronobacter dublinensis]EKM6459538.1 hypothetical protein [Cronobacter dublinensis]ELQ6160448.1 hypothetical protein [Cronobacter dublinensis]MDI7503309.1 hypothetical protein [Cronobacter dublinensis]
MQNISELLQVDKKMRTFGVHAQEVSDHLINLLKALAEKEKSNQKHRDLLITLLNEKKDKIASQVNLLSQEIQLIKDRLAEDPDNDEEKEKLIRKTKELDLCENERVNLADMINQMKSMIETDNVIGEDVESVLRSLKKYNKSFSDDFIAALDIIRNMKGNHHG